MAKILLELSTKSNPGSPVVIDGKRYMLKHPDALTLVQGLRMKAIGEQLLALSQIENPNDAQSGEAASLLAAFCSVVLDAPTDVHERLSDGQRVQIMNVFRDLKSGQLFSPITKHPAARRRTKKR